MKPINYVFQYKGKPGIQKRPRKGKYGNFYDPSAKEKKLLSWEMLQQKTFAGMPLLLGKVGLELVFYGIAKGDLDNAIKFVCDAGNGVLWQDDKQIVAIEANIANRDGEPMTTLLVREIS